MTRDALRNRIIADFVRRGIPRRKIWPGHNVRTRRGWQQLGRMVRPGQRGVTIAVIVQVDRQTSQTAQGIETQVHTRTENRTLYHVSQTVSVQQQMPAAAATD